MNPIIGIYKITSPTGRIYIGQSIDIPQRWTAYKYFERDYECYIKAKKRSLIFQSLGKHGHANHKFEIVENCDESVLNDREIYYIELFKSNARKYPTLRGLNLHEGGTKPPIVKGPRTQEVKDKISQKNKINHQNGKYANVSKSIIKTDLNGNIIQKFSTVMECLATDKIPWKQFRNNFREFNKCLINNFIYYYENPKNFKFKILPLAAKISKPIKVILPKQYLSKEQKSNIFSIAMLKRKSKEEWGEYFRKLNTGRKHLPRPSPQKTEKSIKHLNKLHLINQKQIDQFDLSGNHINTYESFKDAAAKTGIYPQVLYRACIGKIKVLKGCIWKYKIHRFCQLKRLPWHSLVVPR